MTGDYGQCGDEGTVFAPVDADLARRLDRCAEARGEQPADVLDTLARYGLTHHEEAFGEL